MVVSFCHGKSQHTGAKQYPDFRALFDRGDRDVWRCANRSRHAAAPILHPNPPLNVQPHIDTTPVAPHRAPP